MIDERQAGLARSYLFELLPADDLAPLAAVATTRVVERDEHVWQAGGPGRRARR